MTNVGATQVDLGRSVLEPEIAARNDDDDYASGGGFSNLYSIPKYQRETLASYFKHYKPPYPSYSLTGNASVEVNRGVYNRNGRGYDFSHELLVSAANQLQQISRCCVRVIPTIL